MASELSEVFAGYEIDIIECQGSRGCPFVLFIVGASALHHSL